jgi:hypothetical protein
VCSRQLVLILEKYMSEKITIEKAQKFAENMFEGDSTFVDIKESLIRQGLNSIEAEEIIKPFFIKKLLKTIRRQKLISLVLVIVIAALVSLYLFGESKNNELAERQMAAGHASLNKDGSYIVIGDFQSYDFLMKAAVWCAIGLFFTCIRLFMNIRTVKKNN